MTYHVFARATAAAIALFAAVGLSPRVASADAVSDQAKAYKALGIKVPHPAAMCNLITKTEAEHALGMPMLAGTSAGTAHGCAYRGVGNPSVGVLVTRSSRGAWYPPSESSFTQNVKTVSGVGEKAYTAYNNGIGYEAAALGPSGVTAVQLSGKGSAVTALALLRLALNR